MSYSLVTATNAIPVLICKGLSTKAATVTESRFPGVTAKNEAFDHCPFASI